MHWLDSPRVAPPVPGAFSEIKADVLRSLWSIEANGSFAYSEALSSLPTPGLEIQDLGLIGFPLSEREAQAIISKCRLSPFGKGEETITDTSEDELNKILHVVHGKLGLSCDRGDLQAELYKFLIYEEGAFFKSHQDSVKAEGMFGTLVIALPSQHEGGKVVFKHNDLQSEFDSAEYAPFEASFGAWYSDVHHEVQKVTSGYRVVLTYNLVRHASNTTESPPSGQEKHDLKDAILRYEKELSKETTENTESSPGYLIHKLSHLYCEHNLNVKSLKGEDAPEAQCLVNVCQAAGFEVYLGVLEKEISEDKVLPGIEASRHEIFAAILKLDGTKTAIKPVYDHRNLLEEDEEEEGHYAGSEHDEYTGNEGALDTWRYKVSVILIVPPSRTLEFSVSHNTRLADAQNMFAELYEQAKDDEPTQNKLYDLCQLVLRTPKPEDWWEKSDSPDAKQRKECTNQVMSTALKYGWLHLAEAVLLEGSRNPKQIKAYATYIAEHHVENRLDSLWKRSSITLAAKFSMLCEVSSASKDAELPQEAQVAFQKWYHTTLQDILKSDLEPEPGETTVFCNILEICDSDVFDLIVRRLGKLPGHAVARFILQLDGGSHKLQRAELHRWQRAALELFWAKFAYVEELRKDDICKMLEMTLSLGILSISDLLTKLSQGLPALQKWADKDKLWKATPHNKWSHDPIEDYLIEVLLPLVGAVNDRAVSKHNGENNNLVIDILTPWVKAILCLYLHKAVGPEPIAPADWKLDPKCGCGSCKACEKVEKFLVDPVKRALKIKVNAEVEVHLCQKFRPFHWSSFTIQVVPIADEEGRSHWICTKVHKTYKKERSDWQKRHDRARLLLQGIFGKDYSALKIYLVDDFDAITSCRVESVPSIDLSELGDLEEHLPATPHGEGLPEQRLTAHLKRRKPLIARRERLELEMMMAEGLIEPDEEFLREMGELSDDEDDFSDFSDFSD